MAKGLDLLLNKIRSEPAPTLISRYLSLVEDVSDTREKADLVLKLAALLSKSQPDEALRLAHQVYTLDPHRVAALEIMADAFKAKGRFAKAAVIQLEKEKLERRKVPLPQSKPDGDLAPPPDEPEWRIAGLTGMDMELDVGKQVSLSHDESGILLPHLPPEGGELRKAPKVVAAPSALAIGALPSPLLQDGDQDGEQSGLKKPEAKATLLLDGLALSRDEANSQLREPTSGPTQTATDQERKTPPGGLSNRLLRRLMGKEPGDTVLPFPPAASNTTDAPIANAPAPGPPKLPYRGPNTQADQGLAADGSNVLQRTNPAPQPPPLWQALGAQLARLRSQLPLRHMDASTAARMKALFASHPVGVSLPEDFIRALGELDHRLSGSDPVEVLALKWELFQALWGGAPTGACADLLKTLGLRHATPPFWGLYLDGLLADRRFQAALHDMRVTLKKHPHLNWARIVAYRLPIVWQGLNVHGFTWSEDDGVAALVKALAERPKPKLAALLGHTFKPKKVGL